MTTLKYLCGRDITAGDMISTDPLSGTLYVWTADVELPPIGMASRNIKAGETIEMPIPPAKATDDIIIHVDDVAAGITQ